MDHDMFPDGNGAGHICYVSAVSLESRLFVTAERDSYFQPISMADTDIAILEKKYELEMESKVFFDWPTGWWRIVCGTSVDRNCGSTTVVILGFFIRKSFCRFCRWLVCIEGEQRPSCASSRMFMYARPDSNHVPDDVCTPPCGLVNIVVPIVRFSKP